MAFTALLEGDLLSLESVKLGRFVLDAKCPQQDYHEVPGIPTTGSKTQEDFRLMQKNSKCSRLRARFTRIFSADHGNQHTGTATLVSSKAKSYWLENSGAWFKEACKRPETQEWLETAIEDAYPVYLIVGYHTVIDGRVEEKRSSNRGLVGSIHPSALGGEKDGMGSYQTASDEYERQYTAPNEQIFAVQYRKIQFRAFMSRSVDTMSLEHSHRWKPFWGVRGGVYGDGGDDGDELVEACFTEDLSDDGFSESCTMEYGTEKFIFFSEIRQNEGNIMD